ncbi:hypothetical protein AN619_30680 [Thermotalea metallivorans]|uniref:Uncharacterized protein n=1 Tax=Thermotalea metallivorans TaxID=520762 RepID=A0A140KZ80_9FIRM|nr:hypothetical protein AN619_30680 [Thermotalea metallivorans]
MVRAVLGIVLLITGIMTLLNNDNLIYMIIAVIVNSGVNILFEVKADNKKPFNIILNSAVLIVSILIFIKLV